MKLKTKKIEVVSYYEAMVFYRGNQTQAAEGLGVNRGTLSRRIAAKDDAVLQVLRDAKRNIIGFKRLDK